MGNTVNPVRIRLRFADIATFVEKFAPNVTRGGVFLASRNIQPAGTIVPFEIQLVSGEIVMSGQGKVTWVRDFNPAEPNRPYGMGVQFVSLSPTTKVILSRILKFKETNGASVPRGMTAVHATLSSLGANAGLANGKSASPPVDTTVDLAAEYGIDEAAVRRVLDRTRLLAGRIDDDLSDLMKESPIEVVTFAQAWAGLPRLLDPQSSRRRAQSGGLRSVTVGSGGASAAELTQETTAHETTAHETTADDSAALETTQETRLDSGDEGRLETSAAGPASDSQAVPVALQGETSSQRTAAGASGSRGSGRRKRR